MFGNEVIFSTFGLVLNLKTNKKIKYGTTNYRCKF